MRVRWRGQWQKWNSLCLSQVDFVTFSHKYLFICLFVFGCVGSEVVAQAFSPVAGTTLQLPYLASAASLLMQSMAQGSQAS